MDEFDPVLSQSQPDALAYDEFSSRYHAVLALIREASETHDVNLLDIMQEERHRLEKQNPSGHYRYERHDRNPFSLNASKVAISSLNAKLATDAIIPFDSRLHIAD